MLKFTFMMILNIAVISLFGGEKVWIKQLNSQDSAFSQVVDGKIYLNPNRLIDRDGVTYLETDALEYLPIFALFEDDGGPFVYQLSQVRNEKEQIVGYVGGCSKKTVDPKCHLVNGLQKSLEIIVRKQVIDTMNRTGPQCSTYKDDDVDFSQNDSYSKNNIDWNTSSWTDNKGNNGYSGQVDYTHEGQDGSKTEVQVNGQIEEDKNGNYSGEVIVSGSISF